MADDDRRSFALIEISELRNGPPRTRWNLWTRAVSARFIPEISPFIQKKSELNCCQLEGVYRGECGHSADTDNSAYGQMGAWS
jgi:hypothetical protein